MSPSSSGRPVAQGLYCQGPVILTLQDKTRKDIYYRNITSTTAWHTVSKKTLVKACQINSITNQILYYNK